MKRIAAILAVGLSSLGCGSSSDDDGGGASAGGCDTSGTSPSALECQILALVNQTRAAGTTCGGQSKPPAPPLKMNSILRGAARAHAVDMAENHYFSHDSLDGRDPFDRMSDAGYGFSKAGENIAAGSATAEGSMQQWLGSAGHCGNIMDPGFEDLGVGYAFNASHQYRHVWVQKFGRPK